MCGTGDASQPCPDWPGMQGRNAAQIVQLEIGPFPSFCFLEALLSHAAYLVARQLLPGSK